MLGDGEEKAEKSVCARVCVHVGKGGGYGGNESRNRNNLYVKFKDLSYDQTFNVMRTHTRIHTHTKNV